MKAYIKPRLLPLGSFRADTGFLRRGRPEPRIRIPLGA
ncbi:MAG: keywimysin-related RiPP [Microbacteriaceae bacterium]